MSLYYILTCLNLVCNRCNLHSKKTMYLLHLYFYIMTALIWKGNLLVYNFLIYFTTDLFNEYVSKRLTSFTVFHHILSIIIMLTSLYTNTVNNKYIELASIHELSTIPRTLFEMGYLPKPIYNIVFSYSFIYVRLIYYNYNMYNAYLTDGNLFTNTVIIFYTLLNIMNCGIAWKMKLVPKLFGIRAAIDYLLNKRPKIA